MLLSGSFVGLPSLGLDPTAEAIQATTAWDTVSEQQNLYFLIFIPSTRSIFIDINNPASIPETFGTARVILTCTQNEMLV